MLSGKHTQAVIMIFGGFILPCSGCTFVGLAIGAATPRYEEVTYRTGEDYRLASGAANQKSDMESAGEHAADGSVSTPEDTADEKYALPDGAVERLEKDAEECDNNDGEAAQATAAELCVQGKRHLRARRYRRAVGCCEKAIETDPGNAQAYMLLGKANLALGDIDNAVDALRKGVQLEPDKAEYRVALGDAFNALGANWNAIRCYKKALAIDPANKGAHSSLIAAESRVQRYRKKRVRGGSHVLEGTLFGFAADLAFVALVYGAMSSWEGPFGDEPWME